MVKILEINDLNDNKFLNFNLSFDSDTFYFVVGGNKSGKTTLFKIISGLNMINNCVTCDNILLNNKTKYDYIKKIGVVNKVNNNSFIYQKVIDEMMYPLYNLNYSRAKSLIIIKDMLHKFDKEDLINKRISELKDDDKQLLLMMIALLHQPKVLIMDDVLNIFSKEDINNIIEMLRYEDITVIYFSTSLEDCLLFDKLILLNDFKVVKEMNIKEIYDDDKIFYDNNVEIPFICDLSIKLKMYNLINKDYLDIGEMVDDIWD